MSKEIDYLSLNTTEVLSGLDPKLQIEEEDILELAIKLISERPAMLCVDSELRIFVDKKDYPNLLQEITRLNTKRNALRLRTRNEMVLRALSLFTGKSYERKKKLDEFLKDCLSDEKDFNFLLGRQTEEEFFVGGVSSTLEKLWPMAEAQFKEYKDLNEYQFEGMIDDLVWEVNRQMPVSIKEWHIMAKCAQAQRSGANLPTIVATICSIFSVSVPETYKEGKIISFKPETGVDRRRRRRSAPHSSV